MRFLLVLVLFFISHPSYSHQPERGLLTVVTGPFAHQTLHGNTNFLFGLGISAELDFSSVGGLEAGFYYFLKSYKRTFTNNSIIEQVRKLAIPLGYRVWVSPLFSLGIFFNSLFSNGQYQTTYSSAAVTEFTLAREIPEYGLELSLQWEFYNNKKVALLIDGRYFYSLSARVNETADQYNIGLGLKFFGK